MTSCSSCDVTLTCPWCQTESLEAGSSCTWCHTPCRTRSSLQRENDTEDSLMNVSVNLHLWKHRWCLQVRHVPAMQPCDCWTWWNHSDGRYSISPAFTLQRSGRALRYWGYCSRSGSRGSKGIHGTWGVRGGVGQCFKQCRDHQDLHRYLNAPSQSCSDPRPQTRRHLADDTAPADTHLRHTHRGQKVTMVTKDG